MEVLKMTDFEKMISILKDKEEFEVIGVNKKKIIFNEFGMAFNEKGKFEFSFNFKD
jgi:hypothetical protein